ncbi:phage head-tail connector protein [Asticcacaulis sp. ZE23SCel15]|uniref:head-tail connector protein n=1 Tax=Asticcacaulis sp. ZE23SCel15 TaxID=3059027 RepID=UPI00266010EE|nr:phage head-tail connector protein [Asticcacaulis sp. ZE23SCel15]WKL57243.1 phage head-tail connector protein [Asticcacaulis sp. ZE23SCel15]
MSTHKVSLRRVVAPQSLPLTLHEVKVHLGIDSDDWDMLLDGFVSAAVDYLDGRAGYLYRCLMAQTWVAELNEFPACTSGRVVLPLGPVSAVASIEYVATDGTAQTLAAENFDFVPVDGLDYAYVVPAFGEHWPLSRCAPRAVRVTHTCGYGSAAEVPAAIRAAILIMVGIMWRDRGDGDPRGWQENPTALSLLSKYRMVSI